MQQFAPWKLQFVGKVYSLSSDGQSGQVKHPKTGKLHDFTRQSMHLPCLLNGVHQFRPGPIHLRKGQPVTFDIDGDVVSKIVVWNERYLDKASRPFRLVYRTGAETSNSPRFASYKSPKITVMWEGYSVANDRQKYVDDRGRDCRLGDARLYDRGMNAVYFEQYDPDLDRWFKTNGDPRILAA